MPPSCPIPASLYITPESGHGYIIQRALGRYFALCVQPPSKKKCLAPCLEGGENRGRSQRPGGRNRCDIYDITRGQFLELENIMEGGGRRGEVQLRTLLKAEQLSVTSWIEPPPSSHTIQFERRLWNAAEMFPNGFLIVLMTLTYLLTRVSRCIVKKGAFFPIIKCKHQSTGTRPVTMT